MFSARMLTCATAATILLSCVDATAAPPQTVTTPQRGSIERSQILDAIRPVSATKVRFIVHSLRVINGKEARFAYASVEPSRQEYDGGEYILEARSPQGGGKWRVIWAVTGGGTNDCSDVARYYRSVAQHLEGYGVRADILHPGHTDQMETLTASAIADETCTTVGDFGPEITSVGP